MTSLSTKTGLLFGLLFCPLVFTEETVPCPTAEERINESFDTFTNLCPFEQLDCGCGYIPDEFNVSCAVAIVGCDPIIGQTESIDLVNRGIKVLVDDAFRSLFPSDGGTLDLSRNRLPNVNLNAFFGLKLETLAASNNFIENFDFEFSDDDDIPTFSNLILHDNLIGQDGLLDLLDQTIPGSFLKRLVIYNNPVAEFEENFYFLNGAPRLQLVQLRNDFDCCMFSGRNLVTATRDEYGLDVAEKAQFGRRTWFFREVTIANDVTLGDEVILFQNVSLKENVTITATSVIDRNATIGENTFVGYNSFVGNSVLLGKNIFMDPNQGSVFLKDVVFGDDIEMAVVIAEERTMVGSQCSLGTGAILHINVNIDNNTILGIQNVVRDDVKIGSNSSFGDFCLFDRDSQIGQGNRAGSQNVILSDAVIGDYVTMGTDNVIGPRTSIGNYVTIENDVQISLQGSQTRGEQVSAINRDDVGAFFSSFSRGLKNRRSSISEFENQRQHKFLAWEHRRSRRTLDSNGFVGDFAFIGSLVQIGNFPVIQSRARLHMNVTLGNEVVVRDDAVIGASSIIGNLAIIGAETRLGEFSRIGANVVIGTNNTFGDACAIASGVVIGSNNIFGQGVIFEVGAVVGNNMVIESGSIVMEEDDETIAPIETSVGLSAGAVIGIIVGAVVACLFIILLVTYLLWRYKNQGLITKMKKQYRFKEPSSGEAANIIQAVRQQDGYLESSQFVILEELASGAFGVVSKGAVLHGGAMTVCAIKELKQCTTDKDREEFEREAKILKELDHDNVIRLIGISGPHPLNMLLEFMDIGSLDTYLKEEENYSLKHSLRLWFGFQAASGFEYLSSKKIIHRDIAARNILLGSPEDPANPFPVVKIADMGLARITDDSRNYVKQDGGLLPIRWMAPETWPPEKFYSEASDSWSFGILIWEIFSHGSVPYKHEFMDANIFTLKDYLLQEGKRLVFPPHTPQDIQNVVFTCWSSEPTDRPTFEELTLDFTEFLKTAMKYDQIEYDIFHEKSKEERTMTYAEMESSLKVVNRVPLSGAFPKKIIKKSLSRKDKDSNDEYSLDSCPQSKAHLLGIQTNADGYVDHNSMNAKYATAAAPQNKSSYWEPRESNRGDTDFECVSLQAKGDPSDRDDDISRYVEEEIMIVEDHRSVASNQL